MLIDRWDNANSYFRNVEIIAREQGKSSKNTRNEITIVFSSLHILALFLFLFPALLSTAEDYRWRHTIDRAIVPSNITGEYKKISKCKYVQISISMPIPLRSVEYKKTIPLRTKRDILDTFVISTFLVFSLFLFDLQIDETINWECSFWLNSADLRACSFIMQSK